MKLLAVNCNTSRAVTREIEATAQAIAAPGTVVVGATPSWGVASAEGYYESFISAAAVLDLLATWPERFDAVVMAGFGEHGREGARQLLNVPVVDITEAAAITAALIGHRFGVVTTLSSAIGSIEQSLDGLGLASRCAGVRASEVPVVDAAQDVAATADALAEAAGPLLAAGADVLVLGCAGFAGLDALLEERTGVPVVDGVAAAVTLCESLVRQGKRTSKAGAYAAPNRTKPTPGWPVSGPAVR